MRQADLASHGARSTLSTVVVGAMAVFAFGCGLISKDITTISFDLPARSYSFDTQQAGWNNAATTTFAAVPKISCAADTDCCPAFVVAAGIDCAKLVCDVASPRSCAFALTIDTPPQAVNLKAEAPELSSLSGQSVADITISKITYNVTANSLNVDLPPVDLYIAAEGAMTPDDQSAVLIGTVPVIAKQSTTMTPGNVKLIQPGAKNAFTNIGHHIATPFVFFARTRVIVPGGTPVPSGALSLTIGGRLAVQPSL